MSGTRCRKTKICSRNSTSRSISRSLDYRRQIHDSHGDCACIESRVRRESFVTWPLRRPTTAITDHLGWNSPRPIRLFARPSYFLLPRDGEPILPGLSPTFVEINTEEGGGEGTEKKGETNRYNFLSVSLISARLGFHENTAYARRKPAPGNKNLLRSLILPKDAIPGNRIKGVHPLPRSNDNSRDIGASLSVRCFLTLHRAVKRWIALVGALLIALMKRERPFPFDWWLNSHTSRTFVLFLDLVSSSLRGMWYVQDCTDCTKVA